VAHGRKLNLEQPEAAARLQVQAVVPLRVQGLVQGLVRQLVEVLRRLARQLRVPLQPDWL
jgi:hypothetical protein